MAWTYTSSGPTSDTEKVHFLVGDTDTTDQQITDEEIAYCLTRSGSNLTLAAAYACDAVAAKYARKVTKSAGDLSIAYSDLWQHYKDLAASLRRETSCAAVPVGGGISIARVEAVEEDTDRVEPAFKVGMLDNPEVGKSLDDEEEE